MIMTVTVVGSAPCVMRTSTGPRRLKAGGHHPYRGMTVRSMANQEVVKVCVVPA